MGRPLTAPGPVGGCSLAAMVLMGLVVEWRNYRAQGEVDAWFAAALTMGLLLAFGALTLQGRARRVATFAGLYLLLGSPVLLFVGEVARAAGWT